MKKLLLIALASLGLITQNFAETASNTQEVTITIQSLDTLTISNPISITARAGESVNNTESTYTLQMNGSVSSTRTIAVSTASTIPANVTLKLYVPNPSNGTAQPGVTLSNIAQDLVTGIDPNFDSTGTLQYNLAPGANATPITDAKIIVTFTVTI